tara:strand:- start:764 stop:928 length:165 start_codon:yes stop_codon:yes gene_type:complete
MHNTVILVLITVAFTMAGMFLGAWFAARGFEKSLIKMMEDSDAPWNTLDEEDKA